MCNSYFVLCMLYRTNFFYKYSRVTLWVCLVGLVFPAFIIIPIECFMCGIMCEFLIWLQAWSKCWQVLVEMFMYLTHAVFTEFPFCYHRSRLLEVFCCGTFWGCNNLYRRPEDVVQWPSCATTVAELGDVVKANFWWRLIFIFPNQVRCISFIYIDDVWYLILI